MPHLVANRKRHYDLCGTDWEYVNATLYILGGIIFIVGSVMFFPDYSDLEAVGAWLFIFGSVLYTVVAWHDMYESRVTIMRDWKEKVHHHSLSKDQKINWLEAIKWTLAEWVVAIIYTIASLMFIIGSIYFLPTPLKRHPYVGSWLFVWGSALFFFGGCINIVQTYEVDDKILDQLLISTAMTFIVGSILFVVGSIFFLIVWVDDHDEHRSGTFAAWIFVVGSIFFTLGGFTNAIRIWYIKKHHEDKDKLLGWPMAPYPAPMPYFNGGVLPPPSPYMPPYVVPTPVPMM